MSKVNVQFKHEGFSHDAGRRDNDDVDRTNIDSVRTGVLTDEHQEVSDGRPVLVEDRTERVYRAADLPPSTRLIMSDTTDPSAGIVEKAKGAGFDIVLNDK